MIWPLAAGLLYVLGLISLDLDDDDADGFDPAQDPAEGP